MKKEIRIKEKLVKEIHRTENGQERKISYLESDKRYSTKLADGSKKRATTYEAIILKLFDHYHLTVDTFTVDEIFEKALKLKAETKNINPDTLIHNRSNYNRFIDEELRERDIRTITDEDLQKYTLKLVREQTIKDKAYLNYKGVLNLIFDYAMHKQIISFNPVSCINNYEYMKSCESSKGDAETKIFSEEEITRIQKEIRHRMPSKRYHGYFINGYAMLFSIETGVRVGELCALKWKDVQGDRIHIHSQQLHSASTGEYKYVDWTKDEKGRSRGGRYFPLTDKIRKILSELKELQARMNINSEFIFCHEDGEWIKVEAYQTTLRRLCRSLGYEITNNHAFRMSLNSNVFIPAGMTTAMRAELLGHSILTNEKYYSFATKNNVEDALKMLNLQGKNGCTPSVPPKNEKTVSFEHFLQKKNPETYAISGF